MVSLKNIKKPKLIPALVNCFLLVTLANILSNFLQLNQVEFKTIYNPSGGHLCEFIAPFPP